MNKGLIVVGTDTDAGKTAFSLLALAALPGRFAYWKPVETGESDTARIRALLPSATAFSSLLHLAEAVAPALAARRVGVAMPGVSEIVAALPASALPLLIETFGSPLSPLTEDVLQLDLIRALNRPIVLVVSSKVGAVGRALQSARILDAVGCMPTALAIVGPIDPFAEEQLRKHSGISKVESLTLPDGDWTSEGFSAHAHSQRQHLASLLEVDPISERTMFWLERDREIVWHPYTSLIPAHPPLAVVAARDEYLILDDGREIIDGISSWWTILHGHCNLEITAAIRASTRTLDHILFAGATHPAAVDLAEQLLDTVGWDEGGRVFYSDNGSTAVEVALKMAYQFWCHRSEPGRMLFVGFEAGYHGDTFGAMAVGRDPLFFGRFEPLLFRTLRIPVDADALDAALGEHAGQVAACIIEPLVQGAGGMKMHSPNRLRAIAEVCRKRDVLLIADEVMTGFGRTGSFWAFEQARISPDLVCAAKGITGGVLPLSATLISPRVVLAFDTSDRRDTFFHGHSFTANPIACAAAVASGRLMQSGAWRTSVERIRAFWHAHSSALNVLPGVVEVRITGIILAVELDLAGGYLAEGGSTMQRTALESGVLLRPLGNVIYAMPPFCTSNESLERIVVSMTNAIRSCRI